MDKPYILVNPMTGQKEWLVGPRQGWDERVTEEEWNQSRRGGQKMPNDNYPYQDPNQEATWGKTNPSDPFAGTDWAGYPVGQGKYGKYPMRIPEAATTSTDEGMPRPPDDILSGHFPSSTKAPQGLMDIVAAMATMLAYAQQNPNYAQAMGQMFPAVKGIMNKLGLGAQSQVYGTGNMNYMRDVAQQNSSVPGSQQWMQNVLAPQVLGEQQKATDMMNSLQNPNSYQRGLKEKPDLLSALPYYVQQAVFGGAPTPPSKAKLPTDWKDAIPQEWNKSEVMY